MGAEILKRVIRPTVSDGRRCSLVQGRAQLRIGTPIGGGYPLHQPRRALCQRRDCDGVRGLAASAKRVSAESVCDPGLLHDGGAMVLDRALADAEIGGNVLARMVGYTDKLAVGRITPAVIRAGQYGGVALVVAAHPT